MFRRVLSPTDFSAYADTVFDRLPQLKEAGMSQVPLLGITAT